jgi:MFS family permease
MRMRGAGSPETKGAPGARSALAPFRHRIFLAMWGASLVSHFGGLIQNVGASWLMTSLAPSADMVALVQVSSVLPIMLLSLPAGAAADLWDRRTVMLVAQIGMLAVSAALAALAWLSLVTPAILLALTFLLGCGAALYGPAWQSSVREQVPDADLPAAVALNSAGFNLARAAGPALGGVLVATAGAGAAFGVNAVSYLALIGVLVTWPRPKARSGLPPESMGSAMLAGVRYARLSASLRVVLTRGATFGVLAAALWALMPLVARDLLGGSAVTFGLLLGAFGAGAVGGAVISTRLRQRLTSEAILAGASAAFGLTTAVVALSSLLAITMPALAVGGAAWVLALSTLNITVQMRTPRWVVGRAMAVYQAASFGGLALGAWGWGVVADRYGLATSLCASALALLASAVLGRMIPMPAPEAPGLDIAPVRPTDPESGITLDPTSGPVVVSIEYRVAPHDLSAFLQAAQPLRRMRRRNGARRWALLQDAADPEVWVERFESPTWLDRLRIRHRMTVSDQAIEAGVRAFHRGTGSPVTRHLLAHLPTEPGPTAA